MSAKVPQKKRVQKADKVSSASDPTDAEKADPASPETFNSAKSSSIPLPTPETIEIRRALTQLDSIMDHLFELTKTTEHYVDICELRFAMRIGFEALKTLAWKKGPNSQDAIETIFGLTEKGCDILKEAAERSDLRPFVRETASGKPRWPVMMLPPSNKKDKFYVSLNMISLGTHSIPPTAYAKYDITSPWTDLATMLYSRILKFKIILESYELEQQSKNSTSTTAMKSSFVGVLTQDRHPIFRENFEETLEEAFKWNSISLLPWENDPASREQWWAVAEKMLKEYLEANPKEAKNYYAKVRGTSENAGCNHPWSELKKSVKEAFLKRCF